MGLELTRLYVDLVLSGSGNGDRLNEAPAFALKADIAEAALPTRPGAASSAPPPFVTEELKSTTAIPLGFATCV